MTKEKSRDKKYWWLKLKENFFDDEIIDWLLEQPNGEKYCIFYQRLCLKSLKMEGVLLRQVGNFLIPYDIAKIAEFTKTPIDTARVAINLLKQIGLVSIEDNGTIYMTQVKNMVVVSTKKADDMREARRLKKLGQKVISTVSLPCATLGATNVAQSIENRVNSIEHDSMADKPPSPPLNVPFDEIMDLYNSVCVSYPKIICISGNRKKAVQARYKNFPDLNIFKSLFKKAEASDFMKGNNKKNWRANFDWIMCATNFAKVLEGNYDNAEGGSYENAKLTTAQWQGKFSNA